MKIALLSYCCDPERGTEFGLGWGWTEAYWAQGHEVTVYTSCDLRSRRGRARHSQPRGGVAREPRFIELGPVVESSISSPDGLSAMIGFHLHYQKWISAVAEEIASDSYDVVQHVSGGSLQGGFLPLTTCRGARVAGPVGGGQIAPWYALPQFGLGAASEVARSIAWARMPFRRKVVASSVRRADLAYATNRETASMLRRLGARRVEMMLADGIAESHLSQDIQARDEGGRNGGPRLLWVGRLAPRKGVRLLLEVCGELKRIDPAFELRIAGDGPLRGELERAVERKGLSRNVSLLGYVPHDSVVEHLDASDLHLFTSLRDSSGVQCLEAWGRGVPTVHLRLHGIGDFGERAGGIAVDPWPVRTLPARFASAICDGLADEDRMWGRRRLAVEFARRETWSKKAERVLRDLGMEAQPGDRSGRGVPIGGSARETLGSSGEDVAPLILRLDANEGGSVGLSG